METKNEFTQLGVKPFNQGPFKEQLSRGGIFFTLGTGGSYKEELEGKGSLKTSYQLSSLINPEALKQRKQMQEQKEKRRKREEKHKIKREGKEILSEIFPFIKAGDMQGMETAIDSLSSFIQRNKEVYSDNGIGLFREILKGLEERDEKLRGGIKNIYKKFNQYEEWKSYLLERLEIWQIHNEILNKIKEGKEIKKKHFRRRARILGSLRKLHNNSHLKDSDLEKYYKQEKEKFMQKAEGEFPNMNWGGTEGIFRKKRIEEEKKAKKRYQRRKKRYVLNSDSSSGDGDKENTPVKEKKKKKKAPKRKGSRILRKRKREEVSEGESSPFVFSEIGINEQLRRSRRIGGEKENPSKNTELSSVTKIGVITRKRRKTGLETEVKMYEPRSYKDTLPPKKKFKIQSKLEELGL